MSECANDSAADDTASPSPTIRNRLSLFLQLAPPGISKSKPTYPRRSVTPGRGSFLKDQDTGISSADSSTSDKPILDGAVSTASFADSLASAPYASLLFQSRSTEVLLSPGAPWISAPIPIPPTTNELDAEEKMRLLKKMRKLSRVLGEDYPLPSGLHNGESGQNATADAISGSVPASPRPGAKGGLRKSFRHSWTVGYGGAPAPPLPEPTPSPPQSPIEFARPLAAESDSEVVPPSPSLSIAEISAGSDDPTDDDAETCLRRTAAGSASMVFPPENTPEQLQRARAVRITRHLGDDVPPEILFRAASPPSSPASILTLPEDQSPTQIMPSPPIPSLPSPSTPTAPSLNRLLPQRSSSLRRKKGNEGVARRLSLDLKALKSTSSDSSMSAAAGSRPFMSSGGKGTGKLEKPMKRSRSMWARKVFSDADRADFSSLNDEFASPVRESFDTHASGKEPLSERERLRNVKRAKKMTQYFGDQPPSALFQITNYSQDVSEKGDHRMRRDSLATIISIASSVSVAHLDGRAVRNSYMSMSSVLSSSNPAESVTPAATAEVVVDEGEQRQASVDGEQVEDALSEAQYDFPLPPASPPTSLGGLSPPHSPPGGSTLVSVYHAPYHGPPSPRTPPPFSDVFEIDSAHRTSSVARAANGTTASLELPDSKLSVEFHTRQKRAAKLSKFFGVEMNNFADVLPAVPRQSSAVDTNYPFPSPPRGGDRGVASSDDELSVTEHDFTLKPGLPARVEVSTEPGKGPLRFLHGQNARELDMSDAIDKLRRMKSV